MKEEKKTAKKKAAKKSTKKLESILDLNANNIWDLDEFAISEAWERERAEEDFALVQKYRKLSDHDKLVIDKMIDSMLESY